MRVIPFIISTIITVALVFALNKRWGAVPELGKFLSPQTGFWQNAEGNSEDMNEKLSFKNLKGKVNVYLDERLVPHVFAEQDEDAYFVQGYLHAKFRLWQMELQTYAAAGRISEKMGNDPKYINFDREQRRSGMVYAAENALKEIESNPVSKATCDAYTAGVNAYINSLTESTLPLEYKLLGYRPEPWTNLKIALFLKQMSKTLADYGPDLKYTASKTTFSFEEMMQLDPQVPDSLVPIVPKGTVFDAPGIVPVTPAGADSLYFEKKDTLGIKEFSKQDPNNGSNNWVVSGKKTASGATILCNDPHLELTFPSIWFEMQITTPNMNVYGVSFPGSPNIIIGFNDDIAWGVTNSQRDVKDFFQIQFKDDSRQQYLFNGSWKNARLRIDTIKVRGGTDVYDTIAYTVFGPVLYDKSFSYKLSPNKAIALRWSAHDPSNEGLTGIKEFSKQDPNNGSNNWVVSGKKTASGATILCNDPHLELTFPSIWFEMQITTPNMNVYGVSFPGSPNIIIGFNDDIAWGVTNSQRDVKDFFQIQFKDDSRQQYLFNGSWKNARLRIDTIKVRGGTDVYDTIAYTVFGPVLYDKSFSYKLSPNKAIALRWSAHDPSNEGLTFYKLNRSKNYDDYLNAIKTFSCPGQNFVFASKSGDIALWQQAKFPARWYGQGMYLMPGIDSSYMWQGFIPQSENPHVLNPDTGFIQSANQRPVDSAYPYFIPGGFINARGAAISRQLGTMQAITPKDMMTLQNDNFNVFAEGARTMLLKYVTEASLNADAKKYLDILRSWDLDAGPASKGQTVYQLWFDSLEDAVWKDEWEKDSLKADYPDEQTLLEWINKDSAFKYIDNINTPTNETIYDLVTNALQQATAVLKTAELKGNLEWSKYKEPVIYHLLKNAVMPFARKIPVGGWNNTINATTKSHGPSWRMIVQLTSTTEAYGVYPGGQNGNPGSKFYDNFVDDWATGKYYRLWMMKETEKSDKRIIGTLSFTKA